MNQYKVDYINYKGKKETAYVFGKDMQDAGYLAERILGVKKVLVITFLE